MPDLSKLTEMMKVSRADVGNMLLEIDVGRDDHCSPVEYLDLEIYLHRVVEVENFQNVN